jgi:hypothetical protein
MIRYIKPCEEPEIGEEKERVYMEAAFEVFKDTMEKHKYFKFYHTEIRCIRQPETWRDIKKIEADAERTIRRDYKGYENGVLRAFEKLLEAYKREWRDNATTYM